MSSGGKMKDMKVSTSVDDDKKSFFMDLNNYNCKCVAFSCFLTTIFFLLGAFVGTKLDTGFGSNSSPSSDLSPSTNEINNKSPDDAEYSEGSSYDFGVDAMIQNLENLQNNIEKYYDTKKSTFDQIVSGGMGLQFKSSDYEDSIKYLAKIFKRKLKSSDKTIVIGVIGSSVAAGHDNCNYDSFERQLERTMKPFLPSEVKFKVLNAGEGGGCGDTHENQVFCVRQMVGEEADAVVYSWTYFEGGDKGHIQHEELIRWSLMLKNAPPVYILNAGGKKNDCLRDDWNSALFEKYSASYGFNAICMEGALFSNGAYTGKEWGKVGDGLHDVTRYGSYTGNCDENSFEGCDFMGASLDSYRKQSLGVVWRNWHPGPLGFQLASDMFAYIYSEALLVALEQMKTEDPSVKEKEIPVMADDLGEPLFCEKKVCSLEEPPGCLNLEAPVYGFHQISIVPANDDLSPYLSASPKPLDVIDVLQVESKHLKPPSSGWRKDFYGGGQDLVPKREKPEEACRHLDSCGGLESWEAKDGWLVLKLPKMTEGIVIVCGCCGKEVAQEMFIENEFLEIQFDGTTLDRKTFSLYPNPKCAKILNGFPAALNDATGHLYLGLRIISDVPESEKAKRVKMSHVIAF